ncbi:WcaA Glycosyltransferases involved in cell wall biogenesis [uncultured Caudovirales phage]|uniref:WcaA Glycosyltransferases involved in cell wall biogenesis n=1 Tax=uncultured Caudovirales phage TaxID=2100421 RepID=A0A6J7WSH6_9CAUD|nr:WcaA Glycosyltransferases involved in cell wall biogenesis [uncultured Caudovirales phage]CAB5219064.1 WcaA Glycosyltransferases involved in cell wall biogenesis [uncultured Caudovirales phage]
MKIAVYTIALNEEKHVERWYNSVKDADYVLIADTGSTDKTVKIAKKLGINVFNISIKPWRFDDSRNAALALLPDDIDLCISMDMDETLSDGWREKLEQTTGTQISYLFNLTYKDEDEKVPLSRFINNRIHARHGYRWRYLMHEILEPDRLDSHVVEFCEGLEVSHHPDFEKPRSQYNQLIKDALVESPNNPRYLYYLAMEHLQNKEDKEFTSVAKEFLKYSDAHDESRIGIYCFLYMIKRTKANEKYLHKALSESSTRREPLILLAVSRFKQKNWQECYDYTMQALKMTKKYVGLTTGEYAWGFLPYNLLAVSEHNKDAESDDWWTFNVDSIIATNFDLFGLAPKMFKDEILI